MVEERRARLQAHGHAHAILDLEQRRENGRHVEPRHLVDQGLARRLFPVLARRLPRVVFRRGRQEVGVEVLDQPVTAIDELQVPLVLGPEQPIAPERAKHRFVPLELHKIRQNRFERHDELA